MNVAEFDDVIVSRSIAALEDFPVGLEPEFQPDRGTACRRRHFKLPPSAGCRPAPEFVAQT